MGFYIVQFLTGLAQASNLFLVAAGLTLIFGVSRIVNFAHGSLYMLGAYLAYYLMGLQPLSGPSFWFSIIVAAVLVGVIGSAVEILLLRRLYHAPEIFSLMATFGVVLVIQDLSRWMFGSEDLLGPRAPGLDGSVDILGALLPQYDLALISIALSVLVIVWLLLHRTRWGTLVRAATEDRQMLSALGVNQNRIYSSVFVLGAFLTGLGGALQLPKGGADLLMDLNVLAAAFVIVVVGGMGSITGAYLAAVIIGELSTFGILVFPQSTLVMMFLIMALVLIIRPHGLMGEQESRLPETQVKTPRPLYPARRGQKMAAAGLIGLLLVLPLFTHGYVLVLLIETAIMALSAMSLYFMMGPGGMVSFGHAAFFGAGAYTCALLVHFLDSPMIVALITAAAATAVLALLIGWFCVRLSGVYLAMLTLAFAQICWSVVFQWSSFTGGDDGILGVWPSGWAGTLTAFYYATMLACVVGIAFLGQLLFTPFGYVLRACRDSALRVDAIGIDRRRHRWLTFAIVGALTGLAGGLYTFSKGSVFPNEIALSRSFDFLLMVLLGGVETLSGPIVGSAVFTWLHDQISRFQFWQLILGVTFIALVVAFPNGIAGIWDRAYGATPFKRT